MANCENTLPCTCTVDCPRHGKCCECVANHRDKGGIPGCFFTPEGEKRKKRDLESFFEDRRMK